MLTLSFEGDAKCWAREPLVGVVADILSRAPPMLLLAGAVRASGD
jgi:hypothetical protein